jgi:hypothetical protein
MPGEAYPVLLSSISSLIFIISIMLTAVFAYIVRYLYCRTFSGQAGL